MLETRRPANQSGMVSIMVTMIMMMVISLVVIGFAQVSRREARQSLDRQLSAQAYYAAETGVNDARRAIIASGGLAVEKNSCGPSAPYTANPVIDAAHNVSYTCLLVTTKLKNLALAVPTANSVNVPLDAGGAVISSLHINWNVNSNPAPTQADVSSKCGSAIPSPAFPKTANWSCPYGVLRVDFVPTNNLNRAALQAGQKTIFFYPTGGGSVPAFDFASGSGSVAAMACQASAGCDIDVTNMPAGAPAPAYALRLTAVYNAGPFNITAKDAAGAQLELKNAQIQIDSTGKAQDVLRRIQVRLAAVPPGKTPDYALESASSVCKRFDIGSRSFSIPNDIQGQDKNNPMCMPKSVKPPCVVLPKDIMLVLDDSASMLSSSWQTYATRLEKLVEVSKLFVANANIKADGSGTHMAILPFNTTPSPAPNKPNVVQTHLQYDVSALNNAITTLKTYNHCCTLYTQGLQYAYDELASPAARPGVEKVVVFISDGQPTDNNDPLIVSMAQGLQNVATVYTIGISSESVSANAILKAMATPGKFVSAVNTADLDKAIADITTEIKSCGKGNQNSNQRSQGR